MDTKIPYKNCEFCHDLFYPDSKVGNRQRACSKQLCQEKRKRQNQERWVKANPDYFRGRYPQLKGQILENQAKKRLAKKQQSKDRLHGVVDIQDELTVYKNRLLLNINQKVTTIQDELTQIITDNNKRLHAVILKDYTSRVNLYKYKEVVPL